MGISSLHGAVGLVLLVLAAHAAGGPSVKAAAYRSADGTVAGISVTASDPAGLDSVEISSSEADITYHSGLSGARDFQRKFALRELFPDVRKWSRAARAVVTVRNTRGQTTAQTIQFFTDKSK